jgi:hypothetical protein
MCWKKSVLPQHASWEPGQRTDAPQRSACFDKGINLSPAVSPLDVTKQKWKRKGDYKGITPSSHEAPVCLL